MYPLHVRALPGAACVLRAPSALDRTTAQVRNGYVEGGPHRLALLNERLRDQVRRPRPKAQAHSGWVLAYRRPARSVFRSAFCSVKSFFLLFPLMSSCFLSFLFPSLPSGPFVSPLSGRFVR